MLWRDCAFGFAVAEPALIRELIKVKDSYNCDSLSLAGAAAALEDQEYFRATRFFRILATRNAARSGPLSGLRLRRFVPSQANFVWGAAAPPSPSSRSTKRSSAARSSCAI